jgi:acyl-CoA synthetase (AMP-forming)/AMP-acid ligase II
MYLTQALHRAAATTPDAVATICAGRSHSWAEVRERVARFAGALRDLGVKPGDRVAVLSMNSDRYFELYFAVAWAGAVILPMNTRWSVPEHVYSIEDAGATILVLDDTFLETGRAVGDICETIAHVVYAGDGPAPAGLKSYEAMIAGASPAPDSGHGGDDLAGIFYTGGTTGFPKGVMLSHQNLWTGALCVGAGIGYNSSVRYLHAAPMFHLADVGLSNAASIFGGSHVFLPAFEPAALLRQIAEHKATHTLLVPTMIRMLLDSPEFGKHDISSWKGILYGASPMAEALLTEALKRLPSVAFTQGYGQTELAPLATLLGPEWHVFEGPRAGKLRSAGRPGICVELRIVDADGRELPRGQVGEITVRGPNAMRGYWNKPEQTAATLVDGWVRTGDGGYLDEDGFLYVVDRVKDMIVSGGENVYSAEVENALMQHPGVGECAVIGVPDERWGERVHAIVVPRAGQALSADELMQHSKTLIAGYKCPRSVDVRQEALPKSGAGKILKADLRKPYWADETRNVN